MLSSMSADGLIRSGSCNVAGISDMISWYHIDMRLTGSCHNDNFVLKAQDRENSVEC